MASSYKGLNQTRWPRGKEPLCIGTKICYECSVEFDIKEFSPNSHMKDGRVNYCRSCAYDKSCKKKYGYTYTELILIFGDKCNICGATETSQRANRLSIDHCHERNVVRGLLCTNCNNGLGRFKDNIMNLTYAINYLLEGGGLSFIAQ